MGRSIRINALTGHIEKNYLHLSHDFRKRIDETFGGDGRRWLADLPWLLKKCETRWGLKIGSPITPLSYNYVVFATLSNGQQIVLKLGVPNTEFSSEISALRIYNSRGSVHLIDADPKAGILLLERLTPGTMLSDLARQDDEKATRIAARVMKKLWRPLPEDHGFTTIAQLARGFQRLHEKFKGGSGPFPLVLVAEAEEIYQHLMADTESDVLLHGDLHHYNILSAERAPWLAIDPKGVAGDPAYDAGALLRNPAPEIYNWFELAKIQARRLDILADELQIPRRRIQEWAYAQMVLSAWWSFEDEGITSQDWIPIAEQIRDA
jgi:streptomycin 6-kinase